jgi:hypothetical protein
MEHRTRIVYGGRFSVPKNIVRVEEGWQIRYGKSKLITDPTKDIAGARKSLREAKVELISRIKSLPAPTGLRKKILKSKKFKNMPTGISGPRKYKRKGRRIAEYSLQVTIPRFGEKNRTANVYIGTENTITQKRIDAALQKAIGIRNKAEDVYRRAITDAKRKNL